MTWPPEQKQVINKLRQACRGFITLCLCLIALWSTLSIASEPWPDQRTQVGAEARPNLAGSIPAFSGAQTHIPGHWSPGDHYVDPYPSDSPLTTVTKANLAEHDAFLTQGQRQLIQNNPDYKLPIFQTRRSAVYPDFFLAGTRKNRNNARLTEDGNGLVNFTEGFPFPILSEQNRQAALQTLWNHIARYRGGSVERTVIQATVFEDGQFVPIKLHQRYSHREHIRGTSDANDSNILFYYLDRIVAPARLAGDTLLIHETLDQSLEPRRAWVYQKAYKRVRRAPIAEYDTPAPYTYGMRTADSYDMFNGAPDKYEWRYEGKSEKYIPYNAYRLVSPERSYADILKPNAVNATHTRWELHRVHKIVGTLKDGERHIYAKRVLYLDEDSWCIVLAEMYDGHEQLWRVSEGHLMNYYDRTLPYYAMEVTYDLLSKRYIVFGLFNEESKAYTFDKTFSKSDYTPSALRRQSRG